MTGVECIECGFVVDTSDAEEGELITCSECGTEMEVTSLDPLKVQAAPAEEEDWGE